MLQNYIVVNGKKYYSGAIFIVNCMGKECEATFIGHNIQYNSYFFKVNNKICRMSDVVFQNNFVCITDKVSMDEHIPVEKQRKDLDVDGLFLGWVWYIFLMAIAIIFNGAIFLWMMISIVFFSWRASKIKEEGTYIEW